MQMVYAILETELDNLAHGTLA